MNIQSASRYVIEIKTFRNRRINDAPVLEQASNFFLDNLLKRCTISHKLNVTIILKNGAVKGVDNSLNDGLAWENDVIDGVRSFTIHLDDTQPFLAILSTLAHELTHVVQFVTNRLRFDGDDWVWDGKNFGPSPYTGDNDIDCELPWEYDAYSKEPELARKFTKHYYSIW